MVTSELPGRRLYRYLLITAHSILTLRIHAFLGSSQISPRSAASSNSNDSFPPRLDLRGKTTTKNGSEDGAHKYT